MANLAFRVYLGGRKSDGQDIVVGDLVEAVDILVSDLLSILPVDGSAIKFIVQEVGVVLAAGASGMLPYSQLTGLRFIGVWSSRILVAHVLVRSILITGSELDASFGMDDLRVNLGRMAWQKLRVSSSSKGQQSTEDDGGLHGVFVLTVKDMLKEKSRLDEKKYNDCLTGRKDCLSRTGAQVGVQMESDHGRAAALLYRSLPYLHLRL